MIGEKMSKKIREQIQPAQILIVDDDADSALLFESIFAQLGCPTICSLTSLDAKKEICSLKADVIILDWLLDSGTDARSITEQCVHALEKLGVRLDGRRKAKIITCSSFSANEIDQLIQSPYFEHLDHWQKPITHSDLLKRSLNLLDKIGA
jgi:CheY-like chemotaxis protein